MFGPSNYASPLNEAQGNDMQSQTDVEMNVEYTEVISDLASSDADKIIEYEIITVGELEDRTFTNLDNCVPNDAYNDNQDSISRCNMSIEELSPTNEIITVGVLEDRTFTNSDNCVPNDAYNDNQDSISRCKMSIEELSPSSYNDKILSDGINNDDQDSISRCKLSIEELSPSSNNNKILPDGTYNDNQDSISKCKLSVVKLSPKSFNDKILSEGTYNDNQDSISRCKLSIVELSPKSYNDKILSDGIFNDNKDSISRCKMSIEELSPSSHTNHVFKVESENLCLNHLIECVIDDAFDESKRCMEAAVDLDDAFRQCLIEINSDLSNDDYNLDNILKQFKKNGSSTETNHKRKILHSDEFIATDNDNNINCKCGIPKNQSYFENTNKIRIVGDMIHISDKSPKFCKEIYHNISFSQSEIEYFRKTYKKFLQKSICLTLPQQIDKCIECCVYDMKNNWTKRDYDSITCRFYAFRQLRFKKSGRLTVAGYPDPYKHFENDLRMWLPSKHTSDPSDFNIQASTKILGDAGGQFCMFVKDEIDALKLNIPYNGKPRKILWKRCVNGVREMCDVCRTTIFNHHWCCCKCGFVVCVDCFKAKMKNNRLTDKQTIVQRNFNKKIWLLCSNQKEHHTDKLFITQILAGNALNCISELMHETCRTFNIPLNCSCNETLEKIFPPKSTDPIFDNLLNIYEQFKHDDNNDNEEETLGLNALINKQYTMYLNCCDDSSTKGTDESESEDSTSIPRNNVEDTIYTVEHIKKKEWFPPKLSLLSDDKIDAPHMWLCEGHLLRLLDPKSDINYTIFQDQWRRGQPVLVSDVGNKLNSSLWHPESFSRDFGNQINDLINCTTSDVISDQPMSRFWNGFENSEERLCDKQGNVMLLKLKDWPPSADFAETLPERFQDLMNCLPLKEYTHRNGKYNLASRLPDCYVRPDLGPKMYTAYGNAGTKHKKVGTTNLHLDISDAVNVMVYVAITKNCKEYDYNWHVREALQVIEDAGCDDLTLRRIYVHGETPGALWHIYHASDADSIRDLLIKVAVEHGKPLEQFSDPIHDQSHYLDEYLRERLYREYGIKGYAIVQYYGDAVFIPAGAPHQVRNLHNCIKVAEDFVSPENVHHSFRMTQEFRHLTDSHTNHEDKLQIKNIVFHAIKDSISVLTHTSHKL